jgi:hypothetical protein
VALVRASILQGISKRTHRWHHEQRTKSGILEYYFRSNDCTCIFPLRLSGWKCTTRSCHLAPGLFFLLVHDLITSVFPRIHATKLPAPRSSYEPPFSCASTCPCSPAHLGLHFRTRQPPFAIELEYTALPHGYTRDNKDAMLNGLDRIRSGCHACSGPKLLKGCTAQALGVVVDRCGRSIRGRACSSCHAHMRNA